MRRSIEYAVLCSLIALGTAIVTYLVASRLAELLATGLQ